MSTHANDKRYTKAYFDKWLYFLDQKDFTVYQGQRAHFHGCPRFGGIPGVVAPESIIRMIGMDGMRMRDAGGSEWDYPVKDAPAHWRQAGLDWAASTHGAVYDELPAGDPDSIPPFYKDEEESQE